MSSKKSSGFGTSLLVIIVFVLIVGVAGTVVYMTGISPVFNDTVDIYIGKRNHDEAGAHTSITITEIESTEIESTDISEEPVHEASEETSSAPSDQSVVEDVAPISLIQEYLQPDEKAARLIQAGLRNWSGDASNELPELSFFYPRNNDGTWTYPVTDFENRLIPFSPDEQGMYSIGLADEKGGWINALAFVAVFEETGELLSVSVDYHSDRPQVALHLRDDRMYYIVQGFFTDETPVPKNTVLRVVEAL